MTANEEKIFLNKHTTKIAPVGCSFKVGDVVTFKNDYGVKFENRKITGFDKKIKGDRFIYLAKDAYWFPVTEKSLTLQIRKQDIKKTIEVSA